MNYPTCLDLINGEIRDVVEYVSSSTDNIIVRFGSKIRCFRRDLLLDRLNPYKNNGRRIKVLAGFVTYYVFDDIYDGLYINQKDYKIIEDTNNVFFKFVHVNEQTKRHKYKSAFEYHKISNVNIYEPVGYTLGDFLVFEKYQYEKIHKNDEKDQLEAERKMRKMEEENFKFERKRWQIKERKEEMEIEALKFEQLLNKGTIYNLAKKFNMYSDI